MTEEPSKPAPFRTLELEERSLLLSFLALSEHERVPNDEAADDIALSIALKSAMNSSPN